MSSELEAKLAGVVVARQNVLRQQRCVKDLKAKAKTADARDRLTAENKALTQKAHELHMQEQQIQGEINRGARALQKKKAHEALMAVEQQSRVLFNDALRAQCKANLPKGLYSRLCQAAHAELTGVRSAPVTLTGLLRKKGWL